MTTPVPCTPYNDNFDGTKPFTNISLQLLLAASTAISWTVPGTPDQKYRATFRASFTAEIWVRLNGTAAIPSSNTVTNTVGQEFIPLLEPKYVKGGDTLSFISSSTPSIGVQLLQIQNGQ